MGPIRRQRQESVVQPGVVWQRRMLQYDATRDEATDHQAVLNTYSTNIIFTIAYGPLGDLYE